MGGIIPLCTLCSSENISLFPSPTVCLSFLYVSWASSKNNITDPISQRRSVIFSTSAEPIAVRTISLILSSTVCRSFYQRLASQKQEWYHYSQLPTLPVGLFLNISQARYESSVYCSPLLAFNVCYTAICRKILILGIKNIFPAVKNSILVHMGTKMIF